jgi:hypothetical protein
MAQTLVACAKAPLSTCRPLLIMMENRLLDQNLTTCHLGLFRSVLWKIKAAELQVLSSWS